LSPQNNLNPSIRKVIALFNLVGTLAAEVAEIMKSGTIDTSASELHHHHRHTTNGIKSTNIIMNIF
jgi:hypothetical protein